jgi:hypothetical protein
MIESSPFREGGVAEPGVSLEHPGTTVEFRDREGGLGLAWRPTGPDTLLHTTPAQVYIGGGGALFLLLRR